MIRYNFKKDLVKKNNTKIVFCSSYLSIPITINLIEEFQNSLVIVTQSKNICNFLHQKKTKVFGKIHIRPDRDTNPMILGKTLYL